MNDKDTFANKIKFLEENLHKFSDGGLQRAFDSILKYAFESDASIHKQKLMDIIHKLDDGRGYLKEIISKQIQTEYDKTSTRTRKRS